MPDSDVVIHRADRPLREILGVALAGLLHRELIAVEVVAEGAAEVFFGAAQDGLKNAGVKLETAKPSITNCPSAFLIRAERMETVIRKDDICV